MKPIAAAAIAALTLCASPALAALPVGAAAPDFTVSAYQDGKPTPFSLKAALKKGPVVLYFFPAAYTGGCNIEAQEFARAMPDFKKAGATVIGVTGGNTDRLADFSKEHCNGKFPVAAASPQTIKAYDATLSALKASWSSRTSYVIGRNGKIVGVHAGGNPVEHTTATLAVVKSLKK